MPLGPKTRAFFQNLAKLAKASPILPLDSIPIPELRKTNKEAFEAYTAKLPTGVTEDDFRRTSIKLNSSASVPLVTYTPPGYNFSINPTAVFFYGSGFVTDLLPSHFPGIVTFAQQSTCKVIAVDYPLAPECKSDKMPTIAYESVKYIIKHKKTFAINLENFNIIGYSAGGNLAAGLVYQNILNHKKIPINSLILMNPWLDLSFEVHNDNPFIKDQNLDKMLTTETLQYLASLYLAPGADSKDPLISPLFIKSTVLSQFPTTYILSAQYDRLRGMAHAFKKKLEKAKVEVTEKVFEGQTHNYFIARNVMDDGEDPAVYIGKILNT